VQQVQWRPLGPAPRPRYARAMCGRVRLSSDVSEIKLVFSIPPERPTPTSPSWNVTPTDPHPVVRFDQRAVERRLDVMRWGLVPFWGQGHQSRLREYQRRGRGGDREQASLPRVIPAAPLPLPVDNKKTLTGKQPYAVALANRGLSIQLSAALTHPLGLSRENRVAELKRGGDKHPAWFRSRPKTQ
jgi:hypothetical protein